MQTAFGHQLRLIRLRLGLTLNEHAELLGVSQGTYKAWEYGISLPNYEHRAMLCKEYPELETLWMRAKTR